MKAISGSIENLLKTGGALAVLGYMSLRAHLNYLGISNAAPLSTERYLMEVYHWLMVTVPPLLGTALLACLVTCAGIAVYRTIQARRQRAHAGTRLMIPGSPDWHHSDLAAWIAFLAAAVLLAAGNILYPRPPADILVGPIVLSDIPDPGRLARAKTYYMLLCVGCVALGMYLRCSALRGVAARQRLRRLLRGGTWLAFAIMLVWVPLFFGVAGRSFSYPKVQVNTAGGAFSGHLILDSDSGLTLWTLQHAEGHSIHVPRDSIQDIAVGKLEDVLEVARSAAMVAAGKSANQKLDEAAQAPTREHGTRAGETKPAAAPSTANPAS